MSKKGRPKGTRVTQCKCGRRVAGTLGEKKKCPACDTLVTIKPALSRGKQFPMFLKAPRKR